MRLGRRVLASLATPLIALGCVIDGTDRARAWDLASGIELVLLPAGEFVDG